MALNRREWLQRISVGIVGACLVTKVPTEWLPETVRSEAACEFLRRHVNAWFARYGLQQPPQAIVADRTLYDAFARELITNLRFCENGPASHGALLFKGIPVHRSRIASSNGWSVMLVAGEQA